MIDETVVTTAEDKTVAPKKTKTDKLTEFKEQRDKLANAKADSINKAKAYETRIAKLNDKIRNAELQELDAICKKRHIAYSEIIDFLTKLPECVKLSEVNERYSHRAFNPNGQQHF